LIDNNLSLLKNIEQERDDLQSKLSWFQILGKEKNGNFAVASDFARAS
jgi:hypothetical protein